MGDEKKKGEIGKFLCSKASKKLGKGGSKKGEA